MRECAAQSKVLGELGAELWSGVLGRGEASCRHRVGGWAPCQSRLPT